MGNIPSSEVKESEMSYTIKPKAGKHYRIFNDFIIKGITTKKKKKRNPILSNH